MNLAHKKKVGRPNRPNTSFLQNLAHKYSSNLQTSEIADIISFTTSMWGLNFDLLPVQRFVLKAFYGMELDNTNTVIDVYNDVNDKLLATFTEQQFIEFLIEEKRCNLTKYEPGQQFYELVLCIGRRGSKCHWENSWITTTEGTITFKELHESLNKNEKIGIFTYDKNNFKKFITYDLKTELNGVKDTKQITTKFGRNEVVTNEHPYLIWRNDWDRPKWIQVKDVKTGDKLAVATSQNLFGKTSIGEHKAKFLGYLFADGGLTNTVRYTSTLTKTIKEIQNILDVEFPNHIIAPTERYSYIIKRVKQGCKYGNDVVNYIRDNNWNILAKNRYIPSCIKKAPKNEVAIFLNRLFTCDGFVSINKANENCKHSKCTIGITLASKQFIDDIQKELLKFGVISHTNFYVAKCNGKEFNSWSLNIVQSESIIKFQKEIGIFCKEELLQKAVIISKQKTLNKNKLNYMPKGVWNRILNYKEKNKVLLAKTSNTTNQENKRIRTRHALTTKKTLICAKNMEDEFLINISNKDISWDEVIEVKDFGKKQTIALEVANTNIIGNDIISHNSVMSSIIADYELYKLIKRGDPQKYYGFPPGQEIAITSVATSEEQASSLFDMIKMRALNCSYLKERIMNPTQSSFSLQTDVDMSVYGKGKKSSVLILAGSCSSASLRGKNNLVVIMDEAAFFLNNNGRFSGDEVYNALTPSVASFTRAGTKTGGDGKVILLSSPYNKAGLFWDKYNESWGESDNILMFKMYSSMINSTIDSNYLKKQRRRNKTTFLCEYGAEFTDSIVGWVENDELFNNCIKRKDVFSVTKGKGGIQYFLGLDYGAVNDGSAIVVVHKEDSEFVLDYADVWYPANSDVWDFPTSIYKECKELAGYDIIPCTILAEKLVKINKDFPIQSGRFDQFTGYGLQEFIHNKNLEQIKMYNEGPGLNMQMYQLAKNLYMEGLLNLYEHPVLLRELKMLEENRKNKSMKVEAPNRAGAHDDISDAFVRAIWDCYYYHQEKGSVKKSVITNGNKTGSTTNHLAYKYQKDKLRKHGVDLKRVLNKEQKLKQNMFRNYNRNIG